MPDVQLEIYHARNWWGCSSYVRIGYRSIYTVARVSDHGVGAARYYRDTTTTLYLSEGARPGAWELWLADLAARYVAAGGTIPELGGLFDRLTPETNAPISQA